MHLVKPEGDFPTRIATPAFCAVPPSTPHDPRGVRVLPSAGPYYLSSYTPGHEIVLERNPNYHGSRPRHFERIEFAVVPYRQAVADVNAGRADYVWLDGPGAADLRTVASQSATRYGAASTAAKHGQTAIFPRPGARARLLLPQHAPSAVRQRAHAQSGQLCDRSSRARGRRGPAPAPDRPAAQYLPLGMPGYSRAPVLPLSPDVSKGPGSSAGRRQGGRALHLRRLALPRASANRQNRPRSDRRSGQCPSISPPDDVPTRRPSKRAVRPRLRRLDRGLPGSVGDARHSPRAGAFPTSTTRPTSGGSPKPRASPAPSATSPTASSKSTWPATPHRSPSTATTSSPTSSPRGSAAKPTVSTAWTSLRYASSHRSDDRPTNIAQRRRPAAPGANRLPDSCTTGRPLKLPTAAHHDADCHIAGKAGTSPDQNDEPELDDEGQLPTGHGDARRFRCEPTEQEPASSLRLDRVSEGSSTALLPAHQRGHAVGADCPLPDGRYRTKGSARGPPRIPGLLLNERSARGQSNGRMHRRTSAPSATDPASAYLSQGVCVNVGWCSLFAMVVLGVRERVGATGVCARAPMLTLVRDLGVAPGRRHDGVGCPCGRLRPLILSEAVHAVRGGSTRREPAAVHRLIEGVPRSTEVYAAAGLRASSPRLAQDVVAAFEQFAREREAGAVAAEPLARAWR